MLDAGEPAHEWASSQLRKMTGAFSTVWPVISEAVHIIGRRFGASGRTRTLELLWNGKLRIMPLDEGDASVMTYLMAAYQELPMDLADAALLQAYRRGKFSSIMTLDRRDFSIYRLAGKAVPILTPDL